MAMVLQHACIAWALVGSVTAFTQVKPDFSGTWVPIRETGDTGVRPLGPTLVIQQDPSVLKLTRGTGAPVNYRLDGDPTTREEQEDGITRKVTTRTTFSGAVLKVVEEVGVSKREYTFAYTGGARDELRITSSTTLLHTRGGQLTVSTIGPTTRLYRRAK
jgi:hypothetical protein